MHFCQTCQQPLCPDCVLTIHSAKFFASHQISPLNEGGRQRGQLTCPEHKGPFVLFCQETKKLMCIECFNGSSLDKRHSFVNIDAAHKICREKLDKSVIQLRSFQDELIEQVDTRKRLLVDLESKYAEAEEKVLKRHNSLVNELTKTKDELMAEIQETRTARKSQVRQQLKTLENIEGPIRLNLLSASVFCSYASNLDLLHCYAELNRNINTVMSRKTEKVPFSSRLELDCDQRFNELLSQDLESHSTMKTMMPLRLTSTDFLCGVSRSPSEPPSGHGLMQLNSRGALNGLLMLTTSGIDGTGVYFADHFQKIEFPLRQFSDETAILSKDLLGLQRDITFNQRVVAKTTVDELVRRCEDLETRLNTHSTTVIEVHSGLVNMWNEQMEILQRQQLAVNRSAYELATLKEFTHHVLSTSRKLQPLTSFLSSVIQTIRPSAAELTPPMEQICSQIVSITPDSKQRVEAIEKEEEQRRLIREREKRAGEEEARTLKKGLRETRKPRTRPISVLVVENSRDRNSLAEQPTARRKQQRLKRSSQSDECTTDPRTPLPRVFSSTTSLDASSSKTTELSSPASLSPCPFTKELSEKLGCLAALTPGPLVNEKKPQSPVETPAPPPKPVCPPIFIEAAPSVETVQARSLLMQSIKDRVKRID